MSIDSPSGRTSRRPGSGATGAGPVPPGEGGTSGRREQPERTGVRWEGRGDPHRTPRRTGTHETGEAPGGVGPGRPAEAVGEGRGEGEVPAGLGPLAERGGGEAL